MIVRTLGPNGRIRQINLWDEGDPHRPAIAVGTDGIGMNNVDQALAILGPLGPRFSEYGSIFVHNCYAGSVGLPLMRRLARGLNVTVIASYGPASASGPLIGFALIYRRVDPDGTAHFTSPLTSSPPGM